MNARKKKDAEWLLTRQRFHIQDPFPPKNTRKEREIHSILSEVLNEEKPAAVLPKQVKGYWKIIVGNHIASHTEPDSIQNNILYVNVDHPGWLTEIRRIPKNSMLKKMNSIPELSEIRDIHFRLDPSVQTKSWRSKR